MASPELLRGTLTTILLNLLAEKGRMYGYEMVHSVRERSNSAFELTEGAIYPALHRLEADGLVITERVQVGNRERKYYSLTPSGQQASVTKVSEFREYVQAMALLLNPPSLSK